MTEKKFRLVTRSDFDGLVCAVLLKDMDMIDDILFVHPKDMQDGKIEIGANDITTNLPYVAGCNLAFDHHLSETVRNDGNIENHIIDPEAPSAARVVYDYYGGKEKFPNISVDMMDAVDKGDSAQFNEDEVLNPKDWVLLNFIMDARTGLGRFREFRISNYQLMMKLIDCCKDMSIEEIQELEDVKERTELYFDHDAKAKEQIQRCATVHNNLVVLDLTNEETIYTTNRFVIYALYPDCNISIHKMWGLKKQNTVFAIGKSILNRSSNTNVGELCLTYGGGGHLNAGTCQVENDLADEKLNDIIAKINQDG
ncbi:exopolyphosphatase [Marinomonas mediterranea]|uniref:Exopolyphosphatase-related protein n=1 Tax=Marinomonas mediterranea (strain ATCC 700492 / JCM 21426 / NBRC 103028 / MMB-1) TaxID=717774 RepID=F2K2A7_MARM1|nr:exopolyphosphatase [Marinomonas mediterranea]ADZ92287.1 exopolyphosphatase-related protein [Marinomonas mediterranea MMB-1]WCN10238.1 exopolyphosphatase [Marinomonas mediterranea]WCN14286.1 exopolyphosphatase [Marinomonas mediterranea]WCN18338.1 exopolyphosphatase [Marinomonas mediterranea MMB-1]